MESQTVWRAADLANVIKATENFAKAILRQDFDIDIGDFEHDWEGWTMIAYDPHYESPLHTVDLRELGRIYGSEGATALSYDHTVNVSVNDPDDPFVDDRFSKLDYEFQLPEMAELALSEMERDPIILSENQQKAFWNYVISLPVTDTPEGDFIADTIFLYEVWSPTMKDEWTQKADERFCGACDEAQLEHDKLVRQFLYNASKPAI